MSNILIKNIQLDKPYTDIRIMPDGTYYHPFKCFDHEDGEYKALPDNHGRLIDADVFWKRLQKQTMALWGEKSKAYQYFLDVMDMVKSAPTVLEASE